MYSANDQASVGLVSETKKKNNYEPTLSLRKNPGTDVIELCEETGPEYVLLDASDEISLLRIDDDDKLVSTGKNDLKSSSNTKINAEMLPSQNYKASMQESMNKSSANPAPMRMIQMNHERNEMDGCNCFYCGNKVLIPKEARMFKCFFCNSVCDKMCPPQLQKKQMMCGVCRTIIQFTPISNYVRCVCGTVNYVPPVGPGNKGPLPPHEQSMMMNSINSKIPMPQPPGPNQYGQFGDKRFS